MNTPLLPPLKKALLMLTIWLGILCSSLPALELSDIHMPMKRDEADATLSKDYTYAVMTDGSVRRTWDLGDKSVIIDFDTVSNDAIMVAVIYNKPVTKKKGIDDAHTIAAGKFDEKATWDTPKDRDAKNLVENTFGLKNARRKKLEGKAMLFYEMDQKKSHITRVSLFAGMPHTNRWALTTLTKNSGKTAMGNQMSATFIGSLYDDEERRRNTIPTATTAGNAGSAAADTEPAVPQFTISVTGNSSKPKPAAPKEATTPRPTATNTAATPHTATAATHHNTHTAAKHTTTTAPAAHGATHTAPTTTAATTATPATKPASPTAELEPGRHTMSLLPPPPTWLKAVGIEEPTWWHYLGVGLVGLLVLIFVIQTLLQNVGRAAQRKRFADVVSQTSAPASKSRMRRR